MQGGHPIPRALLPRKTIGKFAVSPWRERRLNHIGLCVAHPDATEATVKEMGLSVILMLITSLFVVFISRGMVGLNLKLFLTTEISPTPFLGVMLGASLL